MSCVELYLYAAAVFPLCRMKFITIDSFPRCVWSRHLNGSGHLFRRLCLRWFCGGALGTFTFRGLEFQACACRVCVNISGLSAFDGCALSHHGSDGLQNTRVVSGEGPWDRCVVCSCGGDGWGGVGCVCVCGVVVWVGVGAGEEGWLCCAKYNCQVKSIAGAANLPNEDAAVLFVRCMRIGISVGLKEKYVFSKNTDCESILSPTRQHEDQLTHQHENTTNSWSLNWSSCSCVEGSTWSQRSQIGSQPPPLSPFATKETHDDQTP